MSAVQSLPFQSGFSALFSKCVIGSVIAGNGNLKSFKVAARFEACMGTSLTEALLYKVSHFYCYADAQYNETQYTGNGHYAQPCYARCHILLLC
jgi:hypothetical protein